MLIQALWVNDSKLLQVMDKQLAHLLETQYNVKDVNDFVNMDDHARTQALKGKDADKIAQACNRYPIVNMECAITGAEEQEIELAVTLSRDQQLENDHVICPFYPDAHK